MVIQFYHKSGISTIVTKQLIKGFSKQQIWDFFSDPSNLSMITPEKMDFGIISRNTGATIYPGMMIAYQVKPLFGIPMHWLTEISHIEKGSFFVDEQRRGPYQIWHHEHHFKQVEGGVEMEDIVTYSVGWGLLGNLLNTLIIEPRLRSIFQFRCKAVEKIFDLS